MVDVCISVYIYGFLGHIVVHILSVTYQFNSSTSHLATYKLMENYSEISLLISEIY